jgi:amino acid adenylation domain-containing protein
MTNAGAAYGLSDLLIRAVREHRDRVAVVDGDRRLTYQDLLDAAAHHERALRSAGVRSGDRVGIVLPRSAEAIASLFGIAMVGGVAVPVGERVKHAQVAYTLLHARAAAVVTDVRHEPLLRDVPRELVARLVVTDAGELAGEAPASDAGDSGLDPTACEQRSAIGKDLAALLYTSGSTGKPKGIMVTHENLAWGATIVADYLRLTCADRTVTALPFSFDYGLNQVLTMVHVGGCVVVERSSHPAALCRAIEREGVTGLAGVPLLWQQLADPHSPFFSRPLSSLRYVTNSGGALDPAIVGRFRTEKPEVRVYLMYGFTEAFRSTYLDPDDVDRRPTSIGRAIPNVEILVVGERGEPCEPGEPGELVHRGPTVAAGYWDDPTATARTFRPWPAAGGNGEIAAFSGDLVRADDHGYMYFVGRRDDLFKSRGIRLNPEQIEIELRRCDAIADAIVFTVPSPDGLGEPSIVAVFVAADVAEPLAEAERFCRAELPAHMRPGLLELVPELPVTANGKPDRVRARELWRAPQSDLVDA